MLHDIVKQFFPDASVASIEPYGNGHINTTYKLALEGRHQQYILQHINTQVFRDPQSIAETHLKLQEHLAANGQMIEIADLIPTADGHPLHTDKEGAVWRMTSFITDSHTIEVVEKGWQALEAGKAFGWFAKACSSLDAADFPEAIKDFHRLSFRIGQLNEAIAHNKVGRYDGVKDVIAFFKEREGQLSQVEAFVDQGQIPLRVVHNDTKINNLLFRGEKAVAVIDLDTVGQGILYFDYGDALRTSANTAEEDEKDLDKVQFNMEAFTAFTKGYLGMVRPILSEHETTYFYLAPKLMTYIIGIRFLADYLNGDVYYKTKYIRHNIDRCLVQAKLIESMEQHEEAMKEIIQDALMEVAE